MNKINLVNITDPVKIAAHAISEAEKDLETARRDYIHALHVAREIIRDTIGKGMTTGDILHDCLLLAFNPIAELFERISVLNEHLSTSSGQYVLLGFRDVSKELEMNVEMRLDENEYSLPHRFYLGEVDGNKITAERCTTTAGIPLEDNWVTVFPFKRFVAWEHVDSIEKHERHLHMPTKTTGGASALSFFQHMVPEFSIVPPPDEDVQILFTDALKFREPAGMIFAGPVDSIDKILLEISTTTGCSKHEQSIRKAFEILNSRE